MTAAATLIAPPALTEREQFSAWYAEARVEFLAAYPKAQGFQADAGARLTAHLKMGDARRRGVFPVGSTYL